MSPPRRPARRPAPVPTRRRKRRQKRHASRRLLLVGLVAIPAVLVLLGLGGTAVFGSSCDLSSLRPVSAGENSFVYAWDGSLLGAIPAEQNRTAVTRAEMSPWLPRATVAIEDRRFYSHGGIDPVGIARAIVADIRAGKIVQGGSTITQELVRNLYLSRERTLQRKLVEACLAIKLAHSWSKPRILTAYLNEVYYGAHAYGIEAAAETYFSVPARDLDLEQSALLAGLPQAPSVYDPFHNAPAALARRDQVLKAMLDNGDITRAEYAHAVADRNLHLKAGTAYTRIKEPYFFSYVEDLLQQEYGANTVRSGGLKVYTTINPHFQADAKTAILRILGRSSDPAATVVSIDPRSGAIRAMAAVSPGNQQNQFNFATSALRQPGSTFKTIALTTAVSEGMDPFRTTYLSAPFRYAPDKTCDQTSPDCVWQVQTYDRSYLGYTSVANATLHSDNTVYARLSLDVGPQNIAEMGQKLGIRSKLDVNGYVPPSIALGSVAVTPLDMASAYATLAAGGIYSKPMAITRVVLPNGKIDTDAGWGKPQQERVIPDWVASTVTRVLQLNMTSGTGVGAHVAGHSDAGKTGTTDQYADAWFSGYTPRLEATVWIGYPKGEIPMLDVHGVAVSGPGFPASVWHLFMTSVIGKRKDVPFRVPASTPAFTPWKGKYQFTGGAVPTSTTTTATASTSHRQPSPPATTTTPKTVSIPTVSEPVTTTAPAPVTTTAPPATGPPAVTTTP